MRFLWGKFRMMLDRAMNVDNVCLRVGNACSVFFPHRHPWGSLLPLGVVGNVINLAWCEQERGGGKELRVFLSPSSVPAQNTAGTETTARTRDHAALGVFRFVFFFHFSIFWGWMFDRIFGDCALVFVGFVEEMHFVKGSSTDISKSFVHCGKLLPIFFWQTRMCDI